MFTLIDLPYAPDALEPVISAQTLAFHHGKHLKAYVDNLNRLIVGTEFENMHLEEIVAKAPAGPIFNNTGQILNHNLYFTQFAPADAAKTAPSGPLADRIDKQWGSFEAFKAEFEAKGVSIFGSGWVWLAADKDGTLSILQCPGADNPIACHSCLPTNSHSCGDGNLTLLLTFDVWEHAYYLDFQNRRADHLKALWQIVDWKVVKRRY